MSSENKETKNKKIKELFNFTKSVVYQTTDKIINKYKLGNINKESLDVLIEQMAKESMMILSEKYQIVSKRRNKKNISSDEMCMGRKIDNNRCSRRRINGTCYCKSHNRKLPNGNINDPIPPPKERAKRGRKRKIEFNKKQFDPNFITLWEDIIDGERLLVDSFNNVYSYDTEKPIYLGTKTLDSKLIKCD
tara:strand:- start:285 stop:857 length:573 start_codon:yes stop_codon:yes gene_type:complete